MVGRVLFLFALSLAAFTAEGQRANIVLLIADDLGYGELGPATNTRISTPHLDALAQQGVTCTAGYVTASYCAPSRAGLITGRMQTRFGFEGNPTGLQNTDPAIGLPSNELTLPQVLHNAGYATSLVGKWHLGAAPIFHPQRRGFDEFFGFLHEGHFYVPQPWAGVTTHLRRKLLPDGTRGRWVGDKLQLDTSMGYNEPLYDTDNPILRSSQPIEEHMYLTDAFTREAVSFINRHHDRPFFLTVTYNAVHSPLQGADAYLEKFAHIPDLHRRIFAAMLGNLDDSIGTIMKTLHDTGVAERTLVIFISDNGGATRELTSSNAPLRGEKGTLYEGGIRVPFIMSFPGKIPQATPYLLPVSSLDIFPTACAVAGIEVPKQRDGVNLIPYLNGQNATPPHDSLYWRMYKRSAYRQGDYKIVRHNPDQAWSLYNLHLDLAEANDLASVEPERLERMINAYTAINTTMMEPLF